MVVRVRARVKVDAARSKSVIITRWRVLWRRKTRQEKTRQEDKTRRDEIRRDETRRDETRQDETRRNTKHYHYEMEGSLALSWLKKSQDEDNLDRIVQSCVFCLVLSYLSCLTLSLVMSFLVSFCLVSCP